MKLCLFHFHTNYGWRDDNGDRYQFLVNRNYYFFFFLSFFKYIFGVFFSCWNYFCHVFSTKIEMKWESRSEMSYLQG